MIIPHFIVFFLLLFYYYFYASKTTILLSNLCRITFVYEYLVKIKAKTFFVSYLCYFVEWILEQLLHPGYFNSQHTMRNPPNAMVSILIYSHTNLGFRQIYLQFGSCFILLYLIYVLEFSTYILSFVPFVEINE